MGKESSQEGKSKEKTKKAQAHKELPALLRYADFDYAAFLKRPNVRVLIVIFIVCLTLCFGYWLRGIFVPLLIGLMFAYILNPLVLALQKRKFSRAKAVATIFGGFFLSITLLLVLILPGIVGNILEFSKNAKDLPQHFDRFLENTAKQLNPHLPDGMKIDPAQANLQTLLAAQSSQGNQTQKNSSAAAADLESSQTSKDESEKETFETPAGDKSDANNNQEQSSGVSNFLSKQGGRLFSNFGDKTLSVFDFSVGLLGSVLSWLLFLVLVPLYTFYFMLELDQIWTKTKAYLPGRYRKRILEVLLEIHVMVSAFFRGRLMICVIVALLTTLLYLIFDVPFAIMLGLLGGFGVIIPFFSIIASWLPALAFMFLLGEHSWQSILWVSICFHVIQALEQYWLTPKILGKAVELHPLTLFVGVFVMAQLFGFFGALLAVPLTAIAKILGREFILPYFKALADEPPSAQS